METVEQASAWCVVANVTREPHPEGPDREIRLGLKRFAPGAKVYLYGCHWGDGGERRRVLGRHRGGGRQLIDIIIATKWLTNFRAKQVFHPHVVGRLDGEWNEADAREFAEHWSRRRNQVTGGAECENTS